MLGAFGYFYTVVPVFQHEQLQEAAAKLQLENNASERQLGELRSQREVVQADLKQLEKRWAQEHSRNRQLAEAAESAKDREADALRSAAEAESTLRTQVNALDNARWELVLLDVTFNNTLMNSRSMAEWKKGAGGKPKDEQPGAFILEAGATWPQPYGELLDAVDGAAKARAGKIPGPYYSELREFIKSRRSELQCDTPDLAALQSAHASQLAALKPEIDREVNDYIEQIRREYTEKKENQRVEITSEFRAHAERAIRIGKVLSLEFAYRQKIRDAQKRCEDKADVVLAAFRNAKMTP